MENTQQANLEPESEEPSSAYANNAYLEPSVWDLKIIFGQLHGNFGNPDVDWHTEITMPWLQAKLFSYFLNQNITAYETENGKIRIPQALMPPAPNLPVFSGYTLTSNINLPTASQDVYVTVRSYVSGVWLSSAPSLYKIRPKPTGITSTTMTKSANTAPNLSLPSYYLPNNNQPTEVGPFHLEQCRGGVCQAVDFPNVAWCILSVVQPPSNTYKDFFANNIRQTEGPDFALTFSIPSDTPAGSNTSLECVSDGQSATLYGAINIYDATPVITQVVQEAPLLPGGSFFITIYGNNLGKSGSVNVCRTGFDPCTTNSQELSVTVSSWNQSHDWYGLDNIRVRLTPGPSAGGLYDVQLTSGGAGGLGFYPQNTNSTNPNAKQAGAVSVVQVSMKLERVGPTVISVDGNYSEDTTIRVTAVRTDNGLVIADFTGTVNIAEAGTSIYSQNGQKLQPSVNITSGGTATFVAKSVAEARGLGLPPLDAIITTTNYPVRNGANLSIPQWIISGSSIDPKAAGQVYDWVKSKTFDIARYATTEVSTVINSIGSYSISNIPNPGYHLDYVVTLNPFFPDMRADLREVTLCGTTMTKYFKNIYLHEARHAYQLRQSKIPGRDGDNDTLVTMIDIAPTNIFLDSTTPRNVCNDLLGTPAGGTIVPNWSYHGDSVFDSDLAPDWAVYAREMDAVIFAQTHQN